MKTFGPNDVSVIVTVYNEESNVVSLIKSLLHQTYRPKEIIIVDGGSTDQTFTLLKKYSKIRSFQKPGNRSVGRNFAISKASGKIIAITDAGCLPHPDWLKYLVSPFQDRTVSVVSGYYRGVYQNIFQKCLIPYVLVMPDIAGKQEFYPATRSMAILKTVFTRSGGFDESLSHNEDFAYAHKLKNLGLSFTFAPNALVDWFPRQNLKQASWMFMRFAIGDMQANIIRPKVKALAIRYLIFLYLIFLAPYYPVILYLIFLLIVVYLILVIIKNFRYVRDIRAWFWLPVIQITADISVLFGSLLGLLSKIWT